MMPTFSGTNMAGGVPSHPVSNGVYAVDTMLNELNRQLMGHTRRHSRASNGQARPGTAMRISKPGSANNSPRTCTLHSRRRTMIGDGFQCKLQTRSPAMMDQPYLPTPASETSSEVFHERRGTRPARPLSWHPSSQLPQYHHQQPLFPGPEDNSSAMLCPFPAYNEIDMLEALQRGPPTPAAYSGYASPADAFSPLLLPYPGFGAQSTCSPPQQQQQQRQGMVFSPAVPHNYPSTHPESLDAPYLPPALPALPSPAPAQDAFDWASYPASGSTTTTALLTQHTAPPTPEDFSCSLVANTRQQQHQQQQQQQATEYNTNINSTQQEQQQPPTSSYQPLIIRDDDANTEDDEPEGEILYGMGLYDAPNPNKADLHQSAVFSLLGSSRAHGEETVPGAGRQGLGLKLEDAWEPPASDDEDEDEDQEDGEGDDDEEDDDE